MASAGGQIAMENKTGWNYCDRCKDIKTPNWKCVICEEILCEDCKNNHTKTEIYKNHRVISYEHRKKEVNSTSNLYCEGHHKNKIIMYCDTCEIPVCDECIQTGHTGTTHKLVTIRKCVEKKRNHLLLNARDEVKYQGKELETTLQFLDLIDGELEINASKAVKIRNYAKSLNTAMKNMNTEIHRARDVVKVKKQNIERKMQDIQSSLSMYEETLNTDDDCVHGYIAHNSHKQSIKLDLEVPRKFLSVPAVPNIMDCKVSQIIDSVSEMKMPENVQRMNRMLVVGIDISTSLSGYAMSFRHDYELHPTRISIPFWTTSNPAMTSVKILTCALFNPDGTFHSFGYEAADKYIKLELDGEHHDWFFFREFMKTFYNDIILKQKSMLAADNGKQMPALDVISKTVGFFKAHAMDLLEQRGVSIDQSDVLWVIPVPVILSDSAGQFITEAAEKAGIQRKDIKIVSRPEAASMYFFELPHEMLGCGQIRGISASDVGSKYVVLDTEDQDTCGSIYGEVRKRERTLNTVNITAYEIQPDKRIQELTKTISCYRSVESAYMEILSEIFGADVMDAFSENNYGDYLDLYRELEVRKRRIIPTTTGKLTFKLPISLVETFTDYLGKEIKDRLANSKYRDTVTIAGNKLQMDAELAKSLFRDSIQEIVDHLREFLSNREINNCTSVFMVGELSETQMLQAAVQSNFTNLNVITASEEGLVELKGAVLFGHSR